MLNLPRGSGGNKNGLIKNAVATTSKNIKWYKIINIHSNIRALMLK